MYLYSVFSPKLFNIKDTNSVSKALAAGITSKPTIKVTYKIKSAILTHPVLINTFKGFKAFSKNIESRIRLLPEIAKRCRKPFSLKSVYTSL
jgi:hypothetical protein